MSHDEAPPNAGQIASARASLHAVAELLLSGPQHRENGTIRLRVEEGRVARLDGSVAIAGGDLVVHSGDSVQSYPIRGTIAHLASRAGIEPGAPVGLYHDTSGADATTEVDLDPGHASLLINWYERGRDALRALAPDEVPVLWPEHLDLAINVGEVNYGVSLGDGLIPLPYAYVGPFTARAGQFWNQDFGAARTWTEASDVEAIAEFFRAGRAAAATDA